MCLHCVTWTWRTFTIADLGSITEVVLWCSLVISIMFFNTSTEITNAFSKNVSRQGHILGRNGTHAPLNHRIFVFYTFLLLRLLISLDSLIFHARAHGSKS